MLSSLSHSLVLSPLFLPPSFSSPPSDSGLLKDKLRGRECVIAASLIYDFAETRIEVALRVDAVLLLSSSAAVPEVPRTFSSDNHPAERDARHDTLLAIGTSQENGQSAQPTIREAFVSRDDVENVCSRSIEKVLAKKQSKSSSCLDRHR